PTSTSAVTVPSTAGTCTSSPAASKVATGTSMRITSVRSYGAGGTTYGTRTNACSDGRCGAGEWSNKTPTIAKVAKALARVSQFNRLDRWPAAGSAPL